MMILSATSLLLASLATASFQDSLRPILPGWGRHFWNQRSVVYQHPPAFDFTNVSHAVAYRFDILDDRHNLVTFTAAKPTESLAGVWTNVAVRGLVTVFCHGVDADGRDCGMAGAKRTFWKNPPFDPAKCEPGARPYAEAARKQYEFVLSLPHVRKMVETGKLDYTYAHNCYPTKMNECLIGSALRYADLKPSERERALRIACAAADCLIDLAEPEGTPLAGFTPTYAKGSTLYSAGRYAGQHLLIHPAEAGRAFVKLHRATKDAKYLAAAKRIADTYLRLQGADGTWCLKLRAKDGTPVNPNRLLPFSVCDFLLALAETTGEGAYRAAADRAFAYVEKGPLENWNWEGQFEDVQPSEPYQNLTHHPPCEAALYLLRRYPGDKARLSQARALLDFCEDQFVFWERPCRADGTTVCQPRLAKLAPKWPVLPVVLEQYEWYVPVNASLAKMIRTYLALYRTEQNPLDLAKAKALGDACTRAQCESGCIPSEWMGKIDKTAAHTTWINCQIATAEALEELDACSGSSEAVRE